LTFPAASGIRTERVLPASRAEIRGEALMSKILERARTALRSEISALEELIPRLGESFERAANLIFACKGKVVVTGIGKSGHIANKIAATLASTGTPAFFLHPGEAAHGDLGMAAKGDVVLAISNSGATEEVLRLLSPFRRIGLPVISMTGNPTSELARRSDIHIDVSVAEEACPIGLTPTSSAMAALAMGDAIAVCLLEMRNFRAEDYAVFHPGGSLGKKLMTTVGDLMTTGELVPIVRRDTPVRLAIPELQEKRWGLTSVVDEAGKLVGVFSMGDLTRLHFRDATLAFLGNSIDQYMTRNPKTIDGSALAALALNIMETHKIRALIVIDPAERPIGIVGIYEVLQAIDY
jgi:arabinose-5-phosphate isomerase